MKGEIETGIEYAAMRKDGSKFPISIYSFPIVSKGEIIGLRGFAVDISERKQVEEALRESEKRYHHIFQTTTVSIWEEDVSELKAAIDDLKSQGVKDFRIYLDEHPEFIQSAVSMIRVVDVNNATMKLYGAQNKEQLLGSIEKVFTPESYHVFKEAILSIAEGKTCFESETVNQTLQGKRIDILLTAVIPVEDEKFNRRLISIMDITKLKKAEKVLQSRAEFEKLITSLSTNFINLSSQEIDSGILDALQTIGKFTEADRSYIFLFDENEDKMNRKYEWYAESITPHIEKHHELSFENFLWLMVKLNRFETIHISSVADLLPEGSVEKDILQSQQIQSLFVVPMVSGNSLIGFLGFDAVKMEKIWPADIITLLRIVGEIFTNALNRKRAEEALRESEERYQTILNTAGEGICEIDLEGKITFVNPAGAKMCGYEVHELLGKHLHNSVHYAKPDGSSYPEEECPHYVSLRQGITNEVADELFWKKDGTSFPITSISTPVIVQDMITGAVIAFRDITKRIKAEEAERKSEQMLRNILRGSPIPAFVIDKNHKVLFWNEALEQLSGIKADVMVGTSHHWKTFYTYGRPCMIDLLIDNRIDMIPQWYAGKYTRSKLLEDAFEATDFFPSLGEEGKWLHFTDAVIKDSTGNIVCGLNTLEDITERKSAEGELTFLKEAIEALPIGIIISDVKGKISYANPTGAGMHGYEVDELIGSDVKILSPSKYHQPLLFEQIMGYEMGVWKHESINIRENRETFPVQLTSIAVKNTEGVPIGTVVACEDITERKQAEEKLIQRQEALYFVYKMATALGSSFKRLCDNVVISLSRLLKASHVIAQQNENGKVKVLSCIIEGEVECEEITCPLNFQCLSGYDSVEGCQLECSFGDGFKKYPDVKDILKCSVCIPMIDSAGNIIGAITVMNTEECTFTEDEIRLIKIFAQYVASEIERNAIEIKLRNAQKMEVIGTLAAGVAHEVRNPLNAIMVIAESLVKELGENPEYQTLLTHIRSQVNRLSILMKDLLDLGKSIDPSDFQVQSLSEICSATVSLWKHSAFSHTHKIKLLKSPACDDIFVLADSMRLQQVFLNLLENAAHPDRKGNEILFVVNEPA